MIRAVTLERKSKELGNMSSQDLEFFRSKVSGEIEVSILSIWIIN